MTEVSPVIERTEVIVRGPAEALAGLLGVPLPNFAAGDGVPLLWHWLYLLERPSTADLGPDGHPAVGGLPLPPGPGRRRMFAGGRVTTYGALQMDVETTRRSFVRATKEKDGRSGRLTFTTVAHQITQGGVLVIDEEQDIVYRDAVVEATPTAAAPTGPAEPQSLQPGEWSIGLDPVLLFRFSALTYNGHRIHYDREYCRDVEGYPGLVVHGPLQALVMAEAARALNGPPRPGTTFGYRLVSPLFDHQGMFAVAREDQQVTTAVRDTSGRSTAVGNFVAAQS